MKLYYNPKLKELARELRNKPTHAEKSLWYALKGDTMKGYDFHRQKPLGNFIYDFFCFDLKLLIEVDGATHEEEEVKINDKSKDEYAKSIGLNIIRLTDVEVLGNPNKVVKKIEDFIKNYEDNN
ncbi:endonuclease domain-containing protein [Bacteroidota bacterium]